jgi:hypothetical protein
MLPGSDGDLAGSGTDLDVIAALHQVVVGAPPVGPPPAGPDAELVDGQLGGPAPDADPDGHTPMGRISSTLLAPAPIRTGTAAFGRGSRASSRETPPEISRPVSSRPWRSATTSDIPMLALIAHGICPESIISPRGRWRLGRYLTVTVPPSTRTSGTLPSNRARYRSSIAPSTPIVRWAAPRAKIRRPMSTEPSGRPTPVRIWFSSSRAHLLHLTPSVLPAAPHARQLSR